jgi:hypothetical protein
MSNAATAPKRAAKPHLRSAVFSNVAIRAVSSTTLNSAKHFLTVNGDFARSRDSQLDLSSSDFQDRDVNHGGDTDGFSRFSSEHEHAYSSM